MMQKEDVRNVIGCPASPTNVILPPLVSNGLGSQEVNLFSDKTVSSGSQRKAEWNGSAIFLALSLSQGRDVVFSPSCLFQVH